MLSFNLILGRALRLGWAMGPSAATSRILNNMVFPTFLSQAGLR